MGSQRKIIVIMGVCGSGKTTIGRALAEKLRIPFLDADDFHSRANIEKMRAGIPLTDQDRSPWLATLADELADQEKNGGCVLACSALKAGYRKMLAAHTRPFFVFLKADPDLINKRMAARQGHYMNPALVQSQFETLEEPEDALIVDASLTVPECVSHILAGLDSVNETGWLS